MVIFIVHYICIENIYETIRNALIFTQINLPLSGCLISLSDFSYCCYREMIKSWVKTKHQDAEWRFLSLLFYISHE